MSASCLCKRPTLAGDGEQEHCTTCGCWTEAACRLANQRRAASRTDASREGTGTRVDFSWSTPDEETLTTESGNTHDKQGKQRKPPPTKKRR
jgi:hypothetical protein